MHPKIVESFWSDLDFDQFEGQDLANVRLTFLWTITSPTTNAGGIFPCNRRVFTSDTGLPFEWLEKTMNAFPRSFTYDAPSRHALLRRYVRYQLNEGDKLVANWRMCAKLLSDLRLSPLALALEVIRLHPELGRAYEVKRDGQRTLLLSPSEALAQGLLSPSAALAKKDGNSGDGNSGFTQQNQGSHPSPGSVPHGTKTTVSARAYQGLTKPPAQTDDQTDDQSQTGRGSAEGGKPRAEVRGSNSEVLIPSLAEVIARGEVAGIDRATCEAFHAYHESRGWMSGHTPLRNPLALLPGYAAERRTVKKPGGKGLSARLDAPGSDADEIRAQLQTERDPAKRRALEQRLEATL